MNRRVKLHKAGLELIRKLLELLMNDLIRCLND